MEENTNNLNEKVEELYNNKEFEEILSLLTDEVLEKQKSAELFLWRGVVWYDKKENDKAIADYDKAIELNPDFADAYIYRGISWYDKKDYDSAILDYTKVTEINSNYELAFYNRGLARFAKKEYDNAIKDYSKIIRLNSKYAGIYYKDRGKVWIAQQEYAKAIKDYTNALNINPNDANAYYCKGLAYYNKALMKKEINIDLLRKSNEDFEKYLELTADENDNDNDNGAKYAKHYIEELKVVIKDPNLWSIRQLVNAIKGKLLIEEECVHYTKFSTLKKLILDESKFQISEGNFMNDPSEGKEFFKFLEDKLDTSRKDGSSVETFSPKPFIGSFVTEDKHDDLNMWRFYGKEAGIEAKGCAITLRTQEFIEDIKNSLSNEKNKEARLDDESDISFYRVAYVVHGTSTNFYIPKSDIESEELNKLMTELKDKFDKYKETDRTSLEKYLNNIAFLFKSDAYKNENEVRLVVKGIEFKKKYDMDVIPPRVYIAIVR